MSKIILGFSRSTKKFAPYAKLIMFLDKCNFSHVYVRVPRPSGVDVIYQASGSVINFEGMELFRSHSESIKEFEFEISDEAKSRFFDWAIKYSGTPYSIKQAIGVGIALIFRLDKNPFNPKRPSVCSILGGMVLKDFLEADLSLDRIGTCGPQEIYKICEKLLEKKTGL